jgi:hypothetical protein
MKRLFNIQSKTNKYNQKTITANIVLKEDNVLLNDRNNGLSPLDPKYIKKDKITATKGSTVDYQMFETHKGNLHRITVTKGKNLFSKTVFIKK